MRDTKKERVKDCKERVEKAIRLYQEETGNIDLNANKWPVL